MVEDNITFFVYSDAGYGQSVRGNYPSQTEADLKMSRLAKKGHTNIESRQAQILNVTKYEAKA